MAEMDVSTLKRLAASAFERLGYTILPTWQIDTYLDVRHLRRLFDLLAIDMVIDVGANTGQFRDELRARCGFQGRIASYEAVPDLAHALALRAQTDPLWSVEAVALGSKAGTAEFNVMKDTQFSSFLSPRHDQVSLFKDQNAVQQRVSVEVTTLDAVVKKLNAAHFPRAIYLKVDTQGFDLEVLNGGENALPKIAALQFEASIQPLYGQAPIYHQIIDYAMSKSFAVSRFASNNAGHFPRLIEFDCIMVNSKNLSDIP